MCRYLAQTILNLKCNHTRGLQSSFHFKSKSGYLVIPQKCSDLPQPLSEPGVLSDRRQHIPLWAKQRGATEELPSTKSYRSSSAQGLGDL